MNQPYLGTHIANPPSDSTFRLLLSQLDVDGFDALLQQWMAAQPGVTESVDTLVCDGKTLRGSIAETASGAARFIAQVSLYSNTLGVAIAPGPPESPSGTPLAAPPVPGLLAGHAPSRCPRPLPLPLIPALMPT